MTLDDLYTALIPTFTPSTQKDLKTAVRVLAKALDHANPATCPLDACQRVFTADAEQHIHLAPTLDAYLTTQGKGPHTIRNVKNNLRRLFRAAEQKGLLRLTPTAPTPRYDPLSRPPRPGSESARHDGTYLPFPHWPPALLADFTAFTRWSTDPVVPGRDARWMKRPSTLLTYTRLFEAYFGFLHHIHGVPEVRFDHLFHLSLIQAYVHWHINEKHKRMTVTIASFLTVVKMLCRQYRPHPKLLRQLQKLSRTLPHPTPTYQKHDAWISLDQLTQIGEALWPQKPLTAIRTTGQKFAAAASLSLIFQLWTYIPYRQRNIREMRLDTNLYQDAHGAWRIRFAGEQLKVAVKRGQLNTFDVPFPPPLIPRLELYLSTWRPVLARLTNQAHAEVFLTERGRPHHKTHFITRTKRAVYRYTGKPWHPHIVRTVWATEYLRDTGNFFAAAIMLNDSLETVIKRYAYLRDENVADTAYQWVQSRLTPGATP